MAKALDTNVPTSTHCRRTCSAMANWLGCANGISETIRPHSGGGLRRENVCRQLDVGIPSRDTACVRFDERRGWMTGGGSVMVCCVSTLTSGKRREMYSVDGSSGSGFSDVVAPRALKRLKAACKGRATAGSTRATKRMLGSWGCGVRSGSDEAVVLLSRFMEVVRWFEGSVTKVGDGSSQFGTGVEEEGPKRSSSARSEGLEMGSPSQEEEMRMEG